MSKRQVTITLNQLVDSLGSNEVLGPLDKLINAKLPAALAFRLSTLLDEVAAPIKHFNEAREALIRGLAPGGHDKLEGEALRKFNEGYQEGIAELLREEVTIGVPRFQVSDLGEREILTPGEFYALRWLFVEGPEEFTPQPNGGAELLGSAAS